MKTSFIIETKIYIFLCIISIIWLGFNISLDYFEFNNINNIILYDFEINLYTNILTGFLKRINKLTFFGNVFIIYLLYKFFLNLFFKINNKFMKYNILFIILFIMFFQTFGFFIVTSKDFNKIDTIFILIQLFIGFFVYILITEILLGIFFNQSFTISLIFFIFNAFIERYFWLYNYYNIIIFIFFSIFINIIIYKNYKYKKVLIIKPLKNIIIKSQKIGIIILYLYISWIILFLIKEFYNLYSINIFIKFIIILFSIFTLIFINKKLQLNELKNNLIHYFKYKIIIYNKFNKLLLIYNNILLLSWKQNFFEACFIYFFIFIFFNLSFIYIFYFLILNTIIKWFINFLIYHRYTYF
jgi:hypothetical protein